MGAVIFKIIELIIFIAVSIVYLPMLIFIHYTGEYYEKWVGNILKF